MSRTHSSAYRPALDGLRAIAVLPVLLYHANVGWMAGGFLGVDVFFVLSGYLITSLLVREYAAGRIDLARFYRHRARRLLPALVLVVISVAIWASISSATDRLGQIRADGLATLLYVANWRFIARDQSYFDQFGDPSPFRHMWSLAIEEQYYLFFPLLLLALLRLFRGNKARVGSALGVLALASAALMATLYDPTVDPSRVYFGTDTRIQELFAGAALALTLSRIQRLSSTHRYHLDWLGTVTVAVLFALYVWQTDTGAFPYRGGFLVVCLVVAVLTASVELAPSGWAARLLTWAPLVWVGTISYGLYLWHWPVFVALGPEHTGWRGTRLVIAEIAVTFAIAAASYYLVESPIRSGHLLRRLRYPWGRVAILSALPVALVALLLGTTGATAPPNGSPFAVHSTSGTGEVRVMLVGDSVAQSLAEGFPVNDFPRLTLESSTSIGCGLIPFERWADGPTDRTFLPACVPWFDSLRTTVATDQPDLGLIMFGNGPQFDALIDGEVVPLGSPAHYAYLKSHLEVLIGMFKTRGIPVAVIDMVCHQVADGSHIGRVTNDDQRIQALNQFVAAVADEQSVPVLDLHGLLCARGYTGTLGGQELYRDGMHFTEAGASLVWDYLVDHAPPPVGDTVIATD